MQPIFLKVYHSEKLVTSRQFLSDQVSIGSSTDGPSLVLADPSVCFWHALIEKRGDTYHISDLGSPTGTFVNSKQILESPLTHGDQINIGDFVIQFFIQVPFVKADTPLSRQVPTSQQSSPMPTSAQETPPKAPAGYRPMPTSAQETPPKAPAGYRPMPTSAQETPPKAPAGYRPMPTSAQETPPKAPAGYRPMPTSAQETPPKAPAGYRPMPTSAQETPPKAPAGYRPMPTSVQETPPKAPAGYRPMPTSAQETPPKTIYQTRESLKQKETAEQEERASLSSHQDFERETLSKLEVPDSDELVISPLHKTTLSEQTSVEETTGVTPLKETEVLDSTPSALESSADEPKAQILGTQFQKSYTGSSGTYAPGSAIQDLDHSIPTGSGPVIEIIVTWKERILSVHHFKDKKTITFGSDPKADIVCPNLIGKIRYNLLSVDEQRALVCLSDGVKASIISRKGVKYSFEKLVQKGLVGTLGAHQTLALNQNQLVRLDFSSSLRVYVRYSNRMQKAALLGLFDFNFSEMMGLMMSFFFMSMLFFYLALFSPDFLGPTEDLEEVSVKKATIEFKSKKRVVKLKMADKTKQKKKTKLSIPHKMKAPEKSKKAGIKKQGKSGRLGQVAQKTQEKSKKKTVTSARPGGAVTTKKSGAGPKSSRPDPTKIGLLGVFGSKGTQKELDKAYSGTGEVAGLAEMATGHAGQKEFYTGEGIGTKFKNTGAGGKGSALIGVSAGIKTKGRGGGTKGYGAGGSLGRRGVVQLELGTSDWEVEGGVDKDAILRVIRRNKHQLEWCYEFALQKKPDLEGKVLVQWNIVNEEVRNVKIRSNTTRDSALARCLMSRLQNFRFTGTGLQRGQIGEVSIPFVVTKK